MRGIYVERNQPHIAVWPYLAIGLGEEFWIGLGWLNLEIGWRSGCVAAEEEAQ